MPREAQVLGEVTQPLRIRFRCRGPEGFGNPPPALVVVSIQHDAWSVEVICMDVEDQRLAAWVQRVRHEHRNRRVAQPHVFAEGSSVSVVLAEQMP